MRLARSAPAFPDMAVVAEAAGIGAGSGVDVDGTIKAESEVRSSESGVKIRPGISTVEPPGSTGETLAPRASAPLALERHHFGAAPIAFLIAIHVGSVAAIWQSNWAAVGVCFLLHAVCGGLGICVGYHRLLTHRSFKCPRPVEYSLALLGTLCLEGKPIYWVAQHRQHHRYSDQPGDPHSAREGFWWSHMLWLLWIPGRESAERLQRHFAPDLLRVTFYRILGRLYVWPSVLLGVVLYLAGGWPFVVWGVCVRLVLSYHCTWLVNSASHRFGYRNFPLDNLSTNCWWVALLAYGEGWHNNHHAFPTSARHGLRFWEVDFAYALIRLLKAFGLAWDLKTPAAHKLRLSPL